MLNRWRQRAWAAVRTLFMAVRGGAAVQGDSPEGRAKERHRNIALSAAAAAAAKIISAGTALVSLPLTLHYLGPERYGLWVMISSLVAILSFADLGIGNGIVNSVSAALGRDDRPGVLGFVSSAFFVLSLVATVMFLIFCAAYSWVPWHAVFNVNSAQARAEVGPAVAVFVLCFLLAMPIGIVGRVQVALQRGFLASLWQCLASLLGFAGVLLAIQLEAGLPGLVLAFMGAPLLAALLNSWVFFVYQCPEWRPTRASVSKAASLHLLRFGALFLVLQLVAAIAFASDSFVIAQALGAAAVAEYAVPERMFSIITMVLAMVLAPLWPAYGEAIARGDDLWVRRTLKRSVAIAVGLAAVFSVFMVLVGEWVMSWWVGEAVQPPFLLLMGLAVWKTLEACGSALAVFLNGAHVVRSQVVMAVLTALGALTLKVMLVKQMGVEGTVWATVVAYSVFTLAPVFFLLPGILKRLRRGESANVPPVHA
jgi:O-antigen/teichoic acid export membrane protein